MRITSLYTVWLDLFMGVEMQIAPEVRTLKQVLPQLVLRLNIETHEPHYHNPEKLIDVATNKEEEHAVAWIFPVSYEAYGPVLYWSPCRSELWTTFLGFPFIHRPVYGEKHTMNKHFLGLLAALEESPTQQNISSPS